MQVGVRAWPDSVLLASVVLLNRTGVAEERCQ